MTLIRRIDPKGISETALKFEDKLSFGSGLDPKGPAQADRPQGSLTIWLNVPVVRCDQVWLDQSHKVRRPGCFREKASAGAVRIRVDLRRANLDIRFQTRV
jgi:hypothetical protein